MTEKATKFTMFQKNQADAVFVLTFQAVDLASTEQNTAATITTYFYSSLDSTNWIDVRPSAEILTEAIREQDKVGHVRSRRQQSTSFFTLLIPSHTRSF